MIKPGDAKTFQDYVDELFAPAVNFELHNFDRVAVVFDTYRETSLKTTTRHKRGNCIRRKVGQNSQLSKDWSAFFRIDENKTELFRAMHWCMQVYTTSWYRVLVTRLW